MKGVEFIADTLSVIRSFSKNVKRDIGYQIDRLQRGLDPDDWKPMKTIGTGVREIRVRDTDGIYRTIYFTKKEKHICILHAFKKKTNKTSKKDLDIAKNRFKDIK